MTEQVIVERRFSVPAVLKDGLEVTSRQWLPLSGWALLLNVGPFVPGIAAAVVLGMIMPGALESGNPKSGPLTGVLIGVIMLFWTAVRPIWIKKCMQYCLKRDSTALPALCPQVFLNFIAASFLYALIVSIGCICLLVPGFFLMTRLAFFPYVVVEKQLGPIESLKESFRMTEGISWQIFWYGAFYVVAGGVLRFFPFVGDLMSECMFGPVTAMIYLQRLEYLASTPSQR